MSRFRTLYAAESVFKYFKMLGFFSVTIINGKSVTKPMDIVYLLGSISFGIFICIFSIAHRQDLKTSGSEIAENGKFVTFFMAVVISIISMIIEFFCRHKSWTTIVKLDQIEQKVCISITALNFQRSSNFFFPVSSNRFWSWLFEFE